VQQYQHGRLWVAGLTEEESVAGNRGVAMVDDWNEIPPAGSLDQSFWDGQPIMHGKGGLAIVGVGR
jgi:hypothetical protein